MKRSLPYLTQQEIIARAERQEREFTEEALRRHYQRERDNRPLWHTIFWILAPIAVIIALAAWALWVSRPS